MELEAINPLADRNAILRIAPEIYQNNGGYVVYRNMVPYRGIRSAHVGLSGLSVSNAVLNQIRKGLKQAGDWCIILVVIIVMKMEHLLRDIELHK